MKARTVLRSTLALAATLLLSVTAHAQIFRAYVASDGNDANACTLPAPCRLLPAALNAVADGGEIWMLDSANFNTATVNITKSVSILAVPGAVGSVLAIGGPAISIATGSLKVALRNLVIVPLAGGGGTRGISMTGASKLFIENSLIANQVSDGIYVLGTGTLKITNTIMRNNGNYAVNLQDGASGEVSGTQMLENGGAVVAYGTTATTTTAVVSDSIISGGNVGVSAYTNVAGAVSRAFVTRCSISDTVYGLESGTGGGAGSAVIIVNSTTAVNNTYGYYHNTTGSMIKSLGNNNFADNGSNVGALTMTATLQ
jgi:hypothetical protein